ncbi:MAG: VOC family protein [Alphaproteobacteria bacterium]
MQIKRYHHMALRCRDAKKTLHFYTEILGLQLTAAAGSDYVGSTKEFSPHINLFFQLADGSLLDFIDVPLSEPAQKDPNTPAWVQHLALEVENMDTLLAMKGKLQANGVEVLGPVDHGFCQSIYFFDPSGHRLELAWNNDLGILDRLSKVAKESVAQWEKKKAEGWSEIARAS